MAVDPLRARLDPQDRRMVRDWLTFTCDVHPVSGYDEDSEEVEGRTKKAVPCHIDTSRRRIASATQEIIPIDVTVLFKREQDVDVSYRLSNGKGRDGSVIFAECRVVAVDNVPHPQKVSVLKQAMCVRN
jgi:hypothetical protein